MPAKAIGSGNWNAAGDWTPDEPPFTTDELEAALEWRQGTMPDPALARRDHCPHPTPCTDVHFCIAAIAWYFRHRDAIEQQERYGQTRH